MDTYRKVYGKPAPKRRGRIHPTALASRRGGGVLLRNDKKPIGYWIDGENVILNTSPSLGLGYSEVCQYIVFADGKIQPTNPVRSEVILNTPMKRIR